MTADEVKKALYGRHYASANQMPGPWTCIEEWRNIDLLAISAWSSQGSYARVGYEVKVSRSDLRSELLNPDKRASNVEWCNEFYFAVPRGLLSWDELAYAEPDWPPEAFIRPRCPNRQGYGGRRRRRQCVELVPVPVVQSFLFRRGAGAGYEYIPCRVCGGKGYLDKSQVEKEAPTLWVPRDVGLIVVDGGGTHVVKKAPRRKEVPALSPHELGQFIRYVSMRPDPRHAARVDERAQVAA